MQLVIDIPDEIYKKYMDDRIRVTDVLHAVRHGKPLPEHHGRLVDADAIPRHLVRDIDEIDKQPTIIEGSES